MIFVERSGKGFPVAIESKALALGSLLSGSENPDLGHPARELETAGEARSGGSRVVLSQVPESGPFGELRAGSGASPFLIGQMRVTCPQTRFFRFRRPSIILTISTSSMQPSLLSGWVS